MCLEYKKVESLVEPILVEEVPLGAYIRQNVTTRESDGVVTYCYDECFLETDEYVKTDICAITRSNKSLQDDINALELKRVRAMAEPSVKDTETGLTWLDYYTGQIKDLRSKIVRI